MSGHRIGSNRERARRPRAGERIVVHSEDPTFWLSLRQQAPDLESVWIATHSARECLGAIEDRCVRAVVLDGAARATPADQLFRLIRQIRAALPVIFAFELPDDTRERELREGGVLYYGDRNRTADMLEVIRTSLPQVVPLHPHRKERRSRSDGRL